MRFLNRVLATLLILVCFVPGIAQWVDPGRPDRDSLKGLATIGLSVDLSSHNTYPDDPNERELRDMVEKRLKSFGIRVFKRNQGEPDDDNPTLTVLMRFWNFNLFYYISEIHLGLKQNVRLPSNPDLKLKSTTWEWASGSLGSLRKQESLMEVIDVFICDFRKANPDITGPLPDCTRSKSFAERDEPEKRPRVMTELDDELIRAAAFNNLEDVKSLIAKGANVNAHDPGDATPLSYAVRGGTTRLGDAAVVLFLLEHGANPNVSVSCRFTPLMYAVERGNLKTVKALLGHGADPNTTTPEGYTALMVASVLGSPDAVSLLLNKGANVGARTSYGQTALMLAKEHRNRIAPYDRPAFEPPYTSIPEEELLKGAQTKHDRVIGLLQNSRRRIRK